MQVAHVLGLVIVMALCAQATRHVVTYVDFDHILDFNPSTGKLRAFDFRRFLPTNGTCDFFVYPPLIQESPLIDVVFSEVDPTEAKLSFLGKETFLIQSPTSGSYMVRRCSGFMPQQTTIPCEVYAAGKSEMMKEPHRFFFGTENRVIRYNSVSKVLDLMFYDSDVHGGGFPFSKPLVSGSFPTFNGEVDFSVVTISNPSMKLLVASEVATGAFKVWKFDPLASTIEKVLGKLVLSGTLVPGFHIKTLGEDLAIAYHDLSGDFEIWRVIVQGDKLAIDVVKRDNLEVGHGCIFDDRQTCIAHSGCGWCADSTTCHQLSNNRSACDGYACRDMVDATSPDRKKFQTFEIPIPSMLREFGDAPGKNLTSPLRNLSHASAVPITRNSDLEPEKIEHGFTINPSEGLVFIPPHEEADGSLKYMDSTGMVPVILANITTQEGFMNAADGKKPDGIETSPVGESHEQKDPGFETLPVPPAIANVTKGSFESNPEPIPEAPLEWKVPEGKVNPESIDFRPNDATSIREDDLMNEVESKFSSLLAKGDNMKIVRTIDTKLAPEPKPDTSFHPRDTAGAFVFRPAPPDNTIPSVTLYSTSQMENGALDTDSHQRKGDVQWYAMENARYNSISILNPSAVSPLEITLENIQDQTGKDNQPDQFVQKQQGGHIVEGWDLPDVSVKLGQDVIGSAANGLLTATNKQDLGAKASVAQNVVLDNGSPLVVAPAAKKQVVA